MSKCAFILAGGKGTWLQPFTIIFSNPLVLVVDKPKVKHLKKAGMGTYVLVIPNRDIIRRGLNKQVDEILQKGWRAKMESSHSSFSSNKSDA